MDKIAVAKKFPITDWAEDDRPREKLALWGPKVLSDAELIAILIKCGNPEESAVDLSQKILASAGNNLDQLGRFSMKDFQRFKGMGDAKAAAIVAALELGGRRREKKLTKKIQIRTSRDGFEYLKPLFHDLPHEEFWVLLLNRANKVITCKRISEGGITGTVVDARIVFKLALDHFATSMILCHNHPSGNASPSSADLHLTSRLREGAGLLDITIADHLIIAGPNYFSFADSGQLVL